MRSKTDGALSLLWISLMHAAFVDGMRIPVDSAQDALLFVGSIVAVFGAFGVLAAGLHGLATLVERWRCRRDWPRARLR